MTEFKSLCDSELCNVYFVLTDSWYSCINISVTICFGTRYAEDILEYLAVILKSAKSVNWLNSNLCEIISVLYNWN